jgi:hypothetical protein
MLAAKPVLCCRMLTRAQMKAIPLIKQQWNAYNVLRRNLIFTKYERWAKRKVTRNGLGQFT